MIVNVRLCIILELNMIICSYVCIWWHFMMILSDYFE